jgi:hypothetical protein
MLSQYSRKQHVVAGATSFELKQQGPGSPQLERAVSLLPSGKGVYVFCNPQLL